MCQISIPCIQFNVLSFLIHITKQKQKQTKTNKTNKKQKTNKHKTKNKILCSEL